LKDDEFRSPRFIDFEEDFGDSVGKGFHKSVKHDKLTFGMDFLQN
jgi:hypothetical protein